MLSVETSQPKNPNFRPKKQDPSQQTQKLIQRVEELVCHRDNNLIGGKRTYIAFKSLTSFAIGTDAKGVILVHKGAKIGPGYPLKHNQSLNQLIYCPILDCYFINIDGHLWRKNIDKRDPYLFMRLPGSSVCYAYGFFWSKSLNRLIASTKPGGVLIVNPVTRKVEFALESSVEHVNYTYCFKPFGKGDKKVVVFCNNGAVLLYNLLSGRRGRSLESQSSVRLMTERSEMGSAIQPSSNFKYLILGVGMNRYPSHLSRVVIMGVDRRGGLSGALVCLDLASKRIGNMLCLEYFGKVNGRFLWLGLTRTTKGHTVLLEFDPKRRKLLERTEERVLHSEIDPVSLTKIGESFYYIGTSAKVMRLTGVKNPR